MANKLVTKMKTKSALSPVAPMSKPSFPRANAVDGPEEVNYRAREAMQDILRAETHKKDKKLMAAVKSHVDSLNSVLGGGVEKNGKKGK